MKRISLWFALLLWGGTLTAAFAQVNDFMLDLMREEFDYQLENLRLEDAPSPCYIEGTVTDIVYSGTSSATGADMWSRLGNTGAKRTAMIRLLVGSYDTTQLFSASSSDRYLFSNSFPMEDNERSIRLAYWQAFDNLYKRAVTAYSQKMSGLGKQSADSGQTACPDWVRCPSDTLLLPPHFETPDERKIDRYVLDASKRLLDGVKAAGISTYSDLKASCLVEQSVKRYCNTEHTFARIPSQKYYLTLSFKFTNADGQEEDVSFSRLYASLSNLPSETVIDSICSSLAGKAVHASRRVRAEEVYMGPVLLEEEAVRGYVLNNLLVRGNALYPIRPSVRATASPFLRNNAVPANIMVQMYGKRVVSDELSLYAMTGTPYYKGQMLNGYTPMSDEGVRTDSLLPLIEKGVVKNLLLGRSPMPGIRQKGNGHTGAFGNFRLTTETRFTYDEIKAKLCEVAQAGGLSYAYIVREGLKFQAWSAEPRYAGVYRIDCATGKEEPVGNVRVSVLLRDLRRVVGSTVDEYVSSGYIVPRALLLEDVEFMLSDGGAIPSKPVTPRPE